MSTQVGNHERTLAKKALGKGFNSLLGLNDVQTSNSIGLAKAGNFSEVSVDAIYPNPNQPRKVFKEDALTQLAASIKVDGVIQPLILQEGQKQGSFMIIAGERRWRASKLAGLKTVPAIIKSISDDELLRIALIENIQREDLNAIEEAQAYRLLIEEHGLTQESCAEKVGKDRSSVANILRLLSLPLEVQQDVSTEVLSMGHARALLSLEDKKKILRARDTVVKKKLSVRQTESLCKKLKISPLHAAVVSEGSKSDPDLNHIADALRNQFRTKVKVHGSPSRGKIEISYFTPSELERVLGILGTPI